MLRMMSSIALTTNVKDQYYSQEGLERQIKSAGMWKVCKIMVIPHTI